MCTEDGLIAEHGTIQRKGAGLFETSAGARPA